MDKIRSSEITDKTVYVNRRAFIAAAVAAAGGATMFGHRLRAQRPAAHGPKLTTVRSPLSTTEKPNTWEHITTYNNFYEFGTGKDEPAQFAPQFRPRRPWRVSIEGECAKPGTLTLEDIMKGETLEDRIYRMRCVEGWSMVIPWVGFPLANLIRKCAPTSKAQFVEFTSSSTPARCPVSSPSVLQSPCRSRGCGWTKRCTPWRSSGSASTARPCPTRTARRCGSWCPWKYGFKSGKSIVRIRFLEKQPITSWQRELAGGIRLLLQRESNRGSSRAQPGHRSAPAIGLQDDQDADVQWIRRPGAGALQGDRSAEGLLDDLLNLRIYESTDLRI